ncbi:VOC family protein [Actinoplanes sp. Pm04-4]|uniref:VOC family protein n=1 Tax=Paractinoplanes pyxinae TaxID=2997416 RepID=A0ABT4AUT3_9ACTN|nr:VOC family protein [Actinoplanes pyxinae]MCY1137113.1 VOC family protein [Actinoplanes pyxinae]
MTSIQPIISTPDLPRLRTFYEQVLGATQTLSVPDFYAELTIGETKLGLTQEADTQIGAPVRITLTADVEDVDALLPVVISAGGLAPSPPNNMPWGQRVAHVQDPDGNMLNLTQQL